MLSEDKIKELAHRRATRYTHRTAPQECAYVFTDSHLGDLCRKADTRPPAAAFVIDMVAERPSNRRFAGPYGEASG